jgi:filamentous hemagglutinin family protein
MIERAYRTMRIKYRPSRVLGPLAAAVGMALSGTAPAQIATDGTLGASGPLSGPNYAITANLGRQIGSNLFHSFSTFNVNTGESATFSGPAGIANILSRVTGLTASNIDGVLRSTITGANLFLINPRGILFGPNASLDLTGSFHASTASYIKLADGGRFDAANPAASVLTMAPPAAFGFLGPAAPITVNGSNLSVPDGKSLSLAGGPINVSDASLRTVTGGIGLIAMGGAGEVSIDATSPSLAAPLAPIAITRSSIATESGGGAPGRILIRGGQLALVDSSITSTNHGGADAPPVEMSATSDLDLKGTRVASESHAAGAGADLRMNAARMSLSQTTEVRSETFSAGRGGDLMLNAVDSIRLVSTASDAYYSELISRSRGDGPAGAIVAAADSIRLQSSNVYSQTLGSGNAAPIRLEGRSVDVVDGTWVFSQAWPGTTGRGADIEINGSQRAFVGGPDWGGFAASVFTEAYGPGDGGNIRVRAPEIGVTGGSVYTTTHGSGNSGAMTFDGANVRFLGGNGAVAFIDTTAQGSSTGNGGDIEIRATGEFEISRADFWDWTRLSSSAFSSGHGGNILVAAPSIVVRDRASIWTQATDTGAGGGITLRGGSVVIENGGEVHTHTSHTGKAGNVDISGGEFRSRAGIVDSYTDGSGNAGDIRITAPVIDVLGGRVDNVTFDSGNSGSIFFTGDVIHFRGDGAGLIMGAGTSNFTTGNGGSFEIRAAQEFILSGSTPGAGWTRVANSTQGFGNSGDVIIESPSILIDQALVFSRTRFGNGDLGGIILRGDDVRVQNYGQIVSKTEGDRNGSFILIESRSLFVGDSSHIAADTSGSGDAGRITINAQRVKMTGSSRIDANSFGTGNAGDITINASESFEMSERTPSLTRDTFFAPILTWPGGLRTTATAGGSAGSIVVRAPSILLDDGRILSSAVQSGQGGRVELQADNLILRNGAQVDARSAVGSTGNAGSIDVNVSGRLDISGLSPVDGAFSGLYAETQGSGRGGNIGIAADTLFLDRGLVRSSTGGSGDAGTIRIRANDVVLQNGGWIDAGTGAGSTGAGGSIDLAAARSLVVRGVDTSPAIQPTLDTQGQGITPATPGRAQGPFPSTISSNTAGSGAGGNVSLSSPQITIADGGRVSANSSGQGTAGNIFIQAPDWLLLRNGSITTQALASDGGNIDIRAGNMVRLADSEISTSVGNGQGSGGNIFIDPTFVILDGSRITANAFGGAGGNIDIIASFFFASADSVVEASSQLGVSGNVQISAPNTDPSATLSLLPSTFLDASALLGPTCAGRAGPRASSLIGVGRGGLAGAPDGYSASRYFADTGLHLAQRAGAAEPAPQRRAVSPEPPLLLASACPR